MLNSIKSRTAGKFLVFTFFALLNCCLFAQTPDPYKFFPSAVGNVWEYDQVWGFAREELYKDSVGENDYRYLFYKYNDYYNQNPLYKINLNYPFVYRVPYNPNNPHWLYYKLDADSGDHWMVRPETTELQRMEALVKNKFPAVFLGRETTIMVITFYDLNWGDTVINQFAWPRFTITLGYGIGEIMEIDEEGGGPVRILQGCIIDGDTIGIITSVDDEVISVNSFELFRNYPNPFNPTTTIKYIIAEPQKVKLAVYSLLGEEVKILVDDYKSAGNHSVIFNASDLASGVYIYTLYAGNQSTSKKLILLK